MLRALAVSYIGSHTLQKQTNKCVKATAAQSSLLIDLAIVEGKNTTFKCLLLMSCRLPLIATVIAALNTIAPSRSTRLTDTLIEEYVKNALAVTTITAKRVAALEGE